MDEEDNNLLFENQDTIQDYSFGEYNIFGSKIKRKEITKRFKRPPKNLKASSIYHAKTPQPNYSQFGKARFVDTFGREYKIGKGKIVDNLIESGEMIFSKFDDPPLDKTVGWGTQVCWIRIPITLRGTVQMPEPENEEITLYHPHTQVLIKATTGGMFNYPRAKTGYVILKNFTSFGQVPDPSKFSYLTDKEQKKVYRNKMDYL